MTDSVEKLLKSQRGGMSETEKDRRDSISAQQKEDNRAAIGRVLDTEDGLIMLGMFLNYFGLIGMELYDDNLSRHGAWMVKQIESIRPDIYPKILMENRARNEKYRALKETGGK